MQDAAGEQDTGRGARSGSALLERLRKDPPNLWYGGKQVEDPTEHPAIGRGIHTLAGLYDMQWEDPEATLFQSPDTGNQVGRSFMIPRTGPELESIGRSMKKWASASFGLMGRLPDYINRSISGYAGGADFLAEKDPRFGENIREYHRYMRENDLCLTHTLSSPQANRAKHAAEQDDPYLAAKVKEETSEGIVIRGCRMLATLPVSDEIMVFPSTFLKNTPEHAGYSYAFCIPSNTEGLRFLCRESVDYGRSHYDHPLSSRFEEMDAVVTFDDVLVPWQRVFMYREPERCNASYARTGAVVHMAHQVVVKNVAKTEFLLGVASLVADTIAIEGFQHIQEKIAEIWVNLETMKAFLRTAEVDAELDEWGVMRPAWAPLDAARNLYPRLYPRMVEIIRQMGASGLVAMPTEADVDGPMAADIQRYFQAARAEAHERIPIFRLAWDTAMSAFASRQVLYERFFFGDPVRMAGAVVKSHDRTVYMDRIRDFLANSTGEAHGDGG